MADGEGITLTKDQVDLIFSAYLGIGVLRNILKRAELNMGCEVSEQIINELGLVFPEFPSRSALR